MAILFVHGVATRDDKGQYSAHWAQIKTYLRRYIAPAISPTPDQVVISDAYWGDVGAGFAWGGTSRPRTPLLGQGAGAAPGAIEQALAAAEMPQPLRNLPVSQPATGSAGILVPAGPASAPSTGNRSRVRLKDLPPDQLSDLAVTILQQTLQDSQQQTLASMAADAVAHDSIARAKLAACANRDEELALLQALVEERYRAEQQAQGPGLIAQGGSDWPQRFKDRLGEAIGRIDSTPAFVLSRALVELRKPINDMVTLFLGDVFIYLAHRGDKVAPGEVTSRVLKKLKEARESQPDPNEPMVVVSHSMGGQIIYDLVTYFLPQVPAYQGLRIDFWCATASQVGLFEELKLFHASQEQYSKQHNNQVPFPNRQYLGGWWNVWDHNDFISYSAKNIIAGVDDENYNSGTSVVTAHSGYLERPSFFRAFAEKLKSAQNQNWWRP
jgi:hypothetical protein